MTTLRKAATIMAVAGPIIAAVVWALSAKFADAQTTEKRFGVVEARQANTDAKIDDMHEWMRDLMRFHSLPTDRR